MSSGIEKGIKYSQDQSSIMLLFEHNRQNAVVLRMTLKAVDNRKTGFLVSMLKA